MDIENTWRRLLEFIRRQTGATEIDLLERRRLSGGAIQENHGIKVRLHGGQMPGEQAFVVRSNAAATLSVSLSRAQEYQVLMAAWEAGVPVPRPYWMCQDPTLFGSEFYVMEWAQGSASPRELVRDEALSSDQRRTLVYALGQAIARLHGAKQNTTSLPFLTKNEGSPAQARIAAYRKSLQDLPGHHPVLELALAYLHQYEPEGQTWVLSHCDFRTGNYMVADGQLRAILDWEFASFSDPYEDLGWMCSRCWRFGKNAREAGGVGDKADFFEGYASISGHAVERETVVYWELMACVRWAIIALGQAMRHISGQQESLELALTGRMLPEIEQDTLATLRELLQLRTGRADATDGVCPPARWTTDAVALQSWDRPESAALLAVARGTLMQEILPGIQGDHAYSVRMIARAMEIASREAQIGPHIERFQEAAIAQFCADAALPAEDGPAAAVLASAIRRGMVPEARQSELLALCEALVDSRLAISNPRRISQ